jgi:hypothetical protein
LGGFEIADLLLEGDIRPVSDKSSETRWFNYKGDLMTFDDDDSRSAKAKWAVRQFCSPYARSLLNFDIRLRLVLAVFVLHLRRF